MPKKINLTSENIKEDRIDLLKQLFPEIVAENQIDWEKLRKTLGEDLDINGEKFNFTWAGKSKAIKAVIEPSKATLKPSKEEGIKFDESENIFIEGDNLEVLKLLQKAYFEKVKMIYIDPPYNTGGDFVYKDDFKSPIENYLKQTGQKNGDSEKLTTNAETNGRFHSDWLNMMYPRLKLAWNLLKDDGVIFISIDDNEMHHLRQMMDEIFGEENFLFDLVRKTKTSNNHDVTGLNIQHENTLVYAKNRSVTGVKGDEKKFENYHNPDNDPNGDWISDNPTANLDGRKKKNLFEVKNPYTEKIDVPPTGRHWLFSLENYHDYVQKGKIVFKKQHGKDERSFILKRYKVDIQDDYYKVDSLYFANNDYINQVATKEIANIFGFKAFEYTKPTNFIKKLILFSSNPNDIVLDFFGGSGTTAQAVLELNREDSGNRKFVLVQLPEPTKMESEASKAGYKTIAEITKERIRRVIKGYGDNPQPIEDGFKVFKLDKSNYPENNFEYDPEKSEEENQSAFKVYLDKAGQLPLLESTNDLGVVYENIVKEGLSPNSTVSKSQIGSNNIYTVSDGEQTLYICLEANIGSETVKAFTSPEYKNKVFICLDSAVNDSTKANLSLNLELKTI